jgi:hypothetical protein
MILSGGGEDSSTIVNDCVDRPLKLDEIFSESISCGSNNVADDHDARSNDDDENDNYKSMNDLANYLANGDVEMEEEGERRHIEIEDDNDEEEDDIPPDVMYMDSEGSDDDNDDDDDDDYRHDDEDDDFNLNLRNFLYWDNNSTGVAERMPNTKDKTNSCSENIEALRDNSLSVGSSLSPENDTKNKKGVVSAVRERDTNGGAVDGNDDEYDHDLKNFLYWDNSAIVVERMSNYTPRIIEDKVYSDSKYSSFPHENDTKNKGVSAVGNFSPRSEEQQRIKFEAASSSPQDVVAFMIQEVQEIATLRGVPFATSKAAEDYIFKRNDDSVNNLMDNSVVEEAANNYAWDHELESDDDKETQSDEALGWTTVDYGNNYAEETFHSSTLCSGLSKVF